MKYLRKYENYIDRLNFANRSAFLKQNSKDILTEEDYDLIEQELFNKFKENNINPDANALYFELKMIKNEPKQSYVLPIIKKIYQQKYSDFKYNRNYSAIKFFNYKYKDIIDKYKIDRKTEFDIENDKKGHKLLLPFEGEMIEVPNKIGHNYIPIKILPLEELQTKYSRHKRLKVFAFKGLKCVKCPREGKYLIAAKDRSGAIHIDLYTKDFELMTVDHIKPKWLGGTYDIENLDPMCCFCNTEKGGEYGEYDYKGVLKNENYKLQSEIYDQLVDIVNECDSFKDFETKIIYYGYPKLTQVEVDKLINTEKVSGKEIKTHSPILVGQDIRTNNLYIIEGHNRTKKAKQENIKYIDAYVTRGIISRKGGFSLEPETNIFVEQEKINLLEFYNKNKKFTK